MTRFRIAELKCLDVRPVAVAEPVAVVRHLGALRGRRMPLAGRGLVAAVRRTPAQLDAVVGVIGHFEIAGAVDHVFERERPLRAVAARIGELARRQLRRQHALQLRPSRRATLFRAACA